MQPKPPDRSGRPPASTLRLSRRSFLRGAGGLAGGLAGAALLGACGDSPTSNTTPTGSAAFAGDPVGEVVMANWPLYIDRARDANGERYSPTLQAFEKRTGIVPDYREVITDPGAFLAKLRPSYEAGQPTGYDVIVTGGRELEIMKVRDWLVALDPDLRPGFDANAAAWAVDPAWDLGNRFTMAWQGGFTGIGVDSDRLEQAPATLEDLANPAVVGSHSVGMITSEMPEFVMTNLGIDPATSGPSEWQEAADWLLHQRDSGTVRRYYDQDYIDDLVKGNLSATMAWSGDVFYYSVWGDQPQLRFTFPEGGGLQWADNMAIPAQAEHPVDAMALMDFYYRPEIAVQVAEWVLYLSPVEGVRELVLEHAEEAREDGDAAYAGQLEETANFPFAFPDAALLSRTRQLRSKFADDEELEEWNSIFEPIALS